MNMQYGAQGFALMKSSEGCKLRGHQDSGGIWMIGDGHIGSDVFEGLTIT